MFSDWLVLELTQFQLYGLVFLLGSFTVATLSDLKRMSAQVEFLEVWIFCLVGLFILEVWKLEEPEYYTFAAKWILILIFMLVSNSSFGFILRIARGDVMACGAVMALLTPPLIILFILCLLVLNVFFKPILRAFGDRNGYPFMPVVMTATILVFGTVLYLL